MKSRFYREGRTEARRNPAWQQVRDARHQAIVHTSTAQGKALDAQFFFARNRETNLIAALQGAPTPYVLALSIVRALIFLAIVWTLFKAGLFFLIMVFEAVGFEGESQAIAAFGTAILTFAAVHESLSAWHRRQPVLFSLAATVVGIAMVVQILLAHVRSELLIALMTQANATDINGTTMPTDISEPIRRFYQHAYAIMPMAVPLLTVALELGGGILAYVGLDRLLAPDLVGHLQLAAVRRRMASLVRQKADVLALPQVFQHDFTAGGLVGEQERLQAQAVAGSPVAANQMRNDMKLAILVPVIVVAIILLALVMVRSAGAEPREDGTARTLIGLVDLSRSSAVVTREGRTAFQENCSAAERLINARATPGQRIHIYAITDKSFENPYRLLDARLPTEAGYFGEKSAAAKAAIQKTWRRTCGGLQPSFGRSDVLGAMMLVPYLIETGRSARLVVVSDMRHATPQLNLEVASLPPVRELLERVEKLKLMPVLDNVEVEVYGVYAAGHDARYWVALKDFWVTFFGRTHARLVTFSPLRE